MRWRGSGGGSGLILTAGRRVPGSSIDGAVVLGEVLGVADPLVGVGHQPVGGGVGEGQPAEDVVVRGGGGLPAHQGAGFVVGEGHHQLSTLEVATQHEGHLLHPGDQSPRLHGNLRRGTTEEKGR